MNAVQELGCFKFMLSCKHTHFRLQNSALESEISYKISQNDF